MSQHFNISVKLCGWFILAVGGALILLSVIFEWRDRGNGGLFLGMLGGIITMRSYIFHAVHAGREIGLAEREEEWREAFAMGQDLGHARRDVRSLR